MSEAKYEPCRDDTGGWLWVAPMHRPANLPSDLPYRLFLELAGGEWFEAENVPDHIYRYPTREAAMEALSAARKRAGEVQGG